MKLSMSMLSWYLRSYAPHSSIINDQQLIQGVRFLFDEQIPYLPEYAYVGDARFFLSDDKYANSYIIVHRQSHLLFNNCDYEELLNAALSAFEFFATWEKRLWEAAVRQEPLQAMIDICADVIENPMIAGSLDSDLFAVSKTALESVDPYWDLTIREKQTHPSILDLPFYTPEGVLIKDLTEKPQLVKNVYAGSSPVLMMYLMQNQEPAAIFSILQKNTEQTAMNLQLAPLLASYLQKAAEFTSDSAPLRSRESVIRDLLDGKLLESSIIVRLEKQSQGSIWRLILFCHPLRNDQMQKAGLKHALSKLPMLFQPIIYDGNVLAIIREADFQAAQFQAFFHTEPILSSLCIGISMAASGLESLPTGYQQARFALNHSHRKPGIYFCEDFAFSYLIKMLQEQKLTYSLLHPALDLLKQYDAENNGELRPTLSAFLRNEKNLSKTAQAMNIHRNTLKYRLHRIRELTGLTLTEEQELAYLRLSDWIDSSLFV